MAGSTTRTSITLKSIRNSQALSANSQIRTVYKPLAPYRSNLDPETLAYIPKALVLGLRLNVWGLL